MKKHIPADLLRLKQQFRHWRQTRPGKAKIPEALFKEAVQLSFKYQLAFVCKHLSLSYTDSKIKIQKMTHLSKESLNVENRFVELTPRPIKQPPVLEVKQTQVYCEFEGLKIFLNAPQINDWENLISGLLCAHRSIREAE